MCEGVTEEGEVHECMSAQTSSSEEGLLNFIFISSCTLLLSTGTAPSLSCCLCVLSLESPSDLALNAGSVEDVLPSDSKGDSN